MNQPADPACRTDHTETFVFLLVPDFSLMSLASAVEPLRSLNRLLGRPAYRWRFCGIAGPEISASCMIPIDIMDPAEALEGASYLFVCGGLRIQPQEERQYRSLLRGAARKGIPIGSLSTGTYVLARSGLLDGYRCTIHWENRPAFVDEFPDLDCTGKIYEIDRNRLTCSGGTASMDMVLHLIENRFGADLARGVANQFHHERIRRESDDQRGGRNTALGHLPENLRDAVRIMHGKIEEPLPIPFIARRVGLSTRQIERLFLRFFGKTPLRYYMELRLERARELLLYSDQSVIEIAVQVGFTSTSHFAGWYGRVYGIRPSEARDPRPPVMAAAAMATSSQS